MAKTEDDDRMMSIINRDATFLGRLVNDAIDSGRMLIGKPSVWQEVRAWELREEAAKEQAEEKTDTRQAGDRTPTDYYANVAGDPIRIYAQQGRAINERMMAMTSRAAPMPTTGLSAGQVADRLAAEMARTAPVAEPPAHDVYGMEVTDPFTGKDYRIEAVDQGVDILFRVEDMVSGETLVSGVKTHNGDGPIAGQEAGRKWLEMNVFDMTRTAESAQREPDWNEEERIAHEALEHRDTHHDYAEALADVAGDPTLAWRLEEESPIDILADVRKQARGHGR